jgi:hypothetical protein
MSLNAVFGDLAVHDQTVFWGHAFINPKDIPSSPLSSHSLSGLRMHDTIFASGAAPFPICHQRLERTTAPRAASWLALVLVACFLLLLLMDTLSPVDR